MGEEFMTKYMGSWTWFEAVIIRDFVLPTHNTDSNDGLLSADDITDRLKEAVKRRRKGELLSETEEILSVRTPVTDLSTVKNKSKTTKDVWPIQRNIRASKEPTLYEVYWSKVDLGFHDELDDLEFMDMTGSGRGTGFVQCLRPTDRIGVIGRAMYPGWINNVRKVEIEVWYMV
ncbi:hypothetical protein CPC08DRAFT_712307 [Agrocybe pediades]|nr:hypothetical protein CPC08DRAFT_712307 [Agrocybe pediades]